MIELLVEIAPRRKTTVQLDDNVLVDYSAAERHALIDGAALRIEVPLVVGAGRSKSLHLDQAALAMLSAAERHALIDAIALGEALGAHDDPIVGEADLEALRRILRARLSREPPRTIVDLPAIFSALVLFVARHGTPLMQKRAAEGRLPPREALRALRAWLFAEVDEQFERSPRIRHDEVCNWTSGPGCGRCGHASLEVESRSPVTPLSAAVARELERMRSVAPVGATLDVRELLAACSGCTCRLRRLSARVTRSWEGIVLAREYRLPNLP
jgi:hypothetical protein